MFRMNEFGWLSYAPFEHYKLPVLVRENAVELRRKGSEKGIELPLYGLRWPGRTNKLRHPPKRLMDSWAERGIVKPPEMGDEPNSIGAYLPEEPPESVAYHYMVNELAERPVAGLPPDTVRMVLNARFTIPQDKVPTIQYLAWLAEGHRYHPLFLRFDTNVRESLMGLSNKAASLFFYLIGDYAYDSETLWWSRNDKHRWWPKLAHYLHLVGRSGCATYERLSGLRDARKRFTVLGEGTFPEQMPEVCERLDQWPKLMYLGRSAARLDGKPLVDREGVEEG